MATILQVVHLNYNTDGSQVIAPATWTDLTGMTLAITPTNALSVIRVSAVINGDRLTANVSPLCVRLMRDATPVGIGGGAGVQCYGRIFTGVFFEAFMFVDSPATVAATTYKLQVYDASGNTVYMNRDSTAAYSGMSTLTLEEIG